MDELRQTMSNDEYVRWSVYYAREAQRRELERLKAERHAHG